MKNGIRKRLQQRRPFESLEEHVWLGLQVAANRTMTPWARHLRSEFDLTTCQYNVLRILRGSHPGTLTCGQIGGRMITEEPDVTRLVDRLVKRGLVSRQRSRADRRVVEVGITAEGLDTLQRIDPAVQRMPGDVLGSLNREELEQLATILDRIVTDAGEITSESDATPARQSSTSPSTSQSPAASSG